MDIKLFFLVILSSILKTNASSRIFSKYTSSTHYSTSSPISFLSSNVTVATGLSNLGFNVPLSSTVNVTNNGAAIIITLVPPNPNCIAYGGILGKRVYKFSQIEIIFNNDYRDRCGTVIDGEGTPIELAHIFYYSQYSSLQEAINKPDGIVILVKRAIVQGHISNPNFPPFGKVLKKIIKAGSSTLTPASVAFKWYDILPHYSGYYAYPGTYFNMESRTQNNYAITIDFVATSFPWISIVNYRYFQQIQNKDGLPMGSTLTTYPQHGRPIVQATGIQSLKI